MIIALSTRSDVKTCNIHATMFYAHLHDNSQRRNNISIRYSERSLL